MASVITFTVPGAAKAYARAGSNGVRRYTPKPQAGFANLVKLKAEAAMAGAAPLTGPLRLSVCVRRPVPKSVSRQARLAMLLGATKPVQRPDLDNHAKIIADALNGICWVDDAQVTTLIVTKRYAEIPGVEVGICADTRGEP